MCIRDRDSGAQEVNLEDEGCYTSPKVLSTDENLAKQREQGNQFLQITVTVDFADRKEVINAEVMKDWLATDEAGNVTLDQAKVKAVSYTHLDVYKRQAVHKDNSYYLGVGGGITCESDLEFEYEETLQKARAVLEALWEEV